MAYLTRDDLKRYLGIALADTSEDALLDDLLLAAQAAIDGYCDRTFEAATDTTQTFPAERCADGLVLLVHGDVCQVVGIENGDDAGTLIGADGYTLLPLSGPPYNVIELAADTGLHWEGDVKVTGRWAYSVSAPQGVVQAMREYVAYLYRWYDQQGEDNRRRFETGMPEHIKQLLAPYQRVI